MIKSKLTPAHRCALISFEKYLHVYFPSGVPSTPPLSTPPLSSESLRIASMLRNHPVTLNSNRFYYVN
ncbi:hypothetical protein E2C01_094817 [Portunus trituberculatus]|uniref:Uncharacterized protein n=1 Tax=Portunus trituberculatus TaxID=210409 RepID=A0A5B7K463_PORTR|nr:hypothetical protein [Portunus trituberculatus]